jgi:hypothetical protein
VNRPAYGNFPKQPRSVAWLFSPILFLALLVATGLPAFATDPAQEEVTRDFEKTFTLSGNQGLSLDHRFGQVRIHGGAGHEL